MWFYELSWLWKMLGIGLVAAFACIIFAALFCLAKKIHFRKLIALLIGFIAFIAAIVILLLLAQNPVAI